MIRTHITQSLPKTRLINFDQNSCTGLLLNVSNIGALHHFNFEHTQSSAKSIGENGGHLWLT